ncbi:hypothetical protein ACFP3U_24765 [Kitasatospora misakiensis]|uniref:Uncharacterized protein n=1 Tax=Kitasatospora misakiensis TaxID=67330 RepID=A0ABW0XA39_9ACTN
MATRTTFGEPERHRLEDLELPAELLNDILARTVADVRSCTELDAPAAPGFMFWSRCNRYLAEELIPRGWKHTQRDSILRVIHPSLEFAVTALSGAGGVGDLEARPRSKNPKGPAMARLVDRNGQGAFFTADEVRYGRQLEEMPTWCFLYKRSKRSGISAELSLPVKMNGKFVDEWKYRNVWDLPDIDDPGSDISLLDDPGDNDGPDVLVEFLGGS